MSRHRSEQRGQGAAQDCCRAHRGATLPELEDLPRIANPAPPVRPPERVALQPPSAPSDVVPCPTSERLDHAEAMRLVLERGFRVTVRP